MAATETNGGPPIRRVADFSDCTSIAASSSPQLVQAISAAFALSSGSHPVVLAGDVPPALQLVQTKDQSVEALMNKLRVDQPSKPVSPANESSLDAPKGSTLSPPQDGCLQEQIMALTLPMEPEKVHVQVAQQTTSETRIQERSNIPVVAQSLRKGQKSFNDVVRQQLEVDMKSGKLCSKPQIKEIQEVVMRTYRKGIEPRFKVGAIWIQLVFEFCMVLPFNASKDMMEASRFKETVKSFRVSNSDLYAILVAMHSDPTYKEFVSDFSQGTIARGQSDAMKAVKAVMKNLLWPMLGYGKKPPVASAKGYLYTVKLVDSDRVQKLIKEGKKNSPPAAFPSNKSGKSSASDSDSSDSDDDDETMVPVAVPFARKPKHEISSDSDVDMVVSVSTNASRTSTPKPVHSSGKGSTSSTSFVELASNIKSADTALSSGPSWSLIRHDAFYLMQIETGFIALPPKITITKYGLTVQGTLMTGQAKLLSFFSNALANVHLQKPLDTLQDVSTWLHPEGAVRSVDFSVEIALPPDCEHFPEFAAPCTDGYFLLFARHGGPDSFFKGKISSTSGVGGIGFSVGKSYIKNRHPDLDAVIKSLQRYQSSPDATEIVNNLKSQVHQLQQEINEKTPTLCSSNCVQQFDHSGGRTSSSSVSAPEKSRNADSGGPSASQAGNSNRSTKSRQKASKFRPIVSPPTSPIAASSASSDLSDWVLDNSDESKDEDGDFVMRGCASSKIIELSDDEESPEQNKVFSNTDHRRRDQVLKPAASVGMSAQRYIEKTLAKSKKVTALTDNETDLKSRVVNGLMGAASSSTGVTKFISSGTSRAFVASLTPMAHRTSETAPIKEILHEVSTRSRQAAAEQNVAKKKSKKKGRKRKAASSDDEGEADDASHSDPEAESSSQDNDSEYRARPTKSRPTTKNKDNKAKAGPNDKPSGPCICSLECKAAADSQPGSHFYCSWCDRWAIASKEHVDPGRRALKAHTPISCLLCCICASCDRSFDSDASWVCRQCTRGSPGSKRQPAYYCQKCCTTASTKNPTCPFDKTTVHPSLSKYREL